MYSLKLYNNNNTLLRDFIPCYRKSDGVIGLYDKVEGKFYTNQGSGTFLKGSNINTSTTQTTNTNASIPAEYREVEYIESIADGSYIVTNLTPLYNDKITIDMEIGNYNKTNALWCSRANTSQQTFTSFYINNEGIRGIR